MRFGMNGCFLPDDMRDVTPALCRRVRALGFSGIFTRFKADDPHTTPRATASGYLSRKALQRDHFSWVGRSNLA